MEFIFVYVKKIGRIRTYDSILLL